MEANFSITTSRRRSSVSSFLPVGHGEVRSHEIARASLPTLAIWPRLVVENRVAVLVLLNAPSGDCIGTRPALLFRALTVVHEAEIVLRVGVPGLAAKRSHLPASAWSLGDVHAVEVHEAEVVLGVAEPRLRLSAVAPAVRCLVDLDDQAASFLYVAPGRSGWISTESEET